MSAGPQDVPSLNAEKSITREPQDILSSNIGKSTVREPSSLDVDVKANSRRDNVELSSVGVRTAIGQSMDKFTSLINDNIIAARFGIFATIGLLTAYGISNTPLFFRYRTVAEIPKSYFVGRRRLYCRVISVRGEANVNYATKGTKNLAIKVKVRHLSPIGRLLPKSWFEFLMKSNPSNNNYYRDLGVTSGEVAKGNRDLLNLEIAGVLAPPLSGDFYDPIQFLERLAKNRVLVSCQLLGRRVIATNERNVDPHKRKLSLSGRNDTIDSLTLDDNTTISSSELDSNQVALCRMTYRPGWQIIPTDIAEELVKAGNANVASNILNDTSSSDDSGSSDEISKYGLETKVTHASHRIQDIRHDVKYLDRLETLELGAAQRSLGMWSVPQVREIKKDVFDEADFQAKATLIQKFWRRIRGG